jgi:MOSC domain-containing protein YiiM
LIITHSIFVGQPQELSDENGTWNSSIFRQPVGSIALSVRGLAGDQVADIDHHGHPDQAVCCHSLEHYAYWDEHYGLDPSSGLKGGAVGENWTLTGALEEQICIGDVYTVGSAIVQVSAPRYPCWKQERKVGLPDFLAKTKETLRTGFYLRVLTPGIVTAGDNWTLIERPQREITLQLLNACMHHVCAPEQAVQLSGILELDLGWRGRFERKALPVS